jgi:hypothetical protein
MKRLLLLGLVLLLLVGCVKFGGKGNPGTGGSGSSGGVIQQTRTKVLGTVKKNDMNQLKLLIETDALNGPLPTADQILAGCQKDARHIAKLIQDKVIVLTGARSRQAIWAYTQDPQTNNGMHFAITENGVEEMNKVVLDQRLAQEKGK